MNKGAAILLATHVAHFGVVSLFAARPTYESVGAAVLFLVLRVVACFTTGLHTDETLAAAFLACLSGSATTLLALGRLFSPRGPLWPEHIMAIVFGIIDFWDTARLVLAAFQQGPIIPLVPEEKKTQ